MNQKYFLAVMSVRAHANNIGKRVKGVEALDETGLIYHVSYWDGFFQQFRISTQDSSIVYMTQFNETI